MTTHYLILDSAGNVKGSGLTPDNTIPDGRIVCTQAQAQSPFDWAVVNGEIVASPNLLVNAQAAQSQILSNACAVQITSGFSSSALGSANIYASTDIDQRNLLAAAQATNGGLLSCQNASGVWARASHTKAQGQQALDDFSATRDAARTTLGTLVAQVNAATSVAEVQTVIWKSAS